MVRNFKIWIVRLLIDLFLDHFEIDAIFVYLEKRARHNLRFAHAAILFEHGLEYPFCPLFIILVPLGREINTQCVARETYLSTITRAITILPGDPIVHVVDKTESKTPVAFHSPTLANN